MINGQKARSNHVGTQGHGGQSLSITLSGNGCEIGARNTPRHVDMDFGEALERLGTTDPKEMDELLKRNKRNKKAGKVKDPPSSQADRKDESG